jgi:hypothetical protein
MTWIYYRPLQTEGQSLIERYLRRRVSNSVLCSGVLRDATTRRQVAIDYTCSRRSRKKTRDQFPEGA